jgi:hypothetical protein
VRRKKVSIVQSIFAFNRYLGWAWVLLLFLLLLLLLLLLLAPNEYPRGIQDT